MKKIFGILSLFFVLMLANVIFPQEDIMNAARQNQFDTVKKMLQENKNLINSKDN